MGKLTEGLARLAKLFNSHQLAYKPPPNLSFLAQSINRNIAFYPTTDLSTYSERYCETDDIYSIIKMLANTAALIPVYGYEVKEEKAFKKLSRIKQQHNKIFESKALMLKALEDLPDNDRVAMLIEDPCPDMSKFEFFEAVFTFLLSAGEAFIYKVRPEVGVNAGLTTALYPLYPQNVILKVSESLPRKVVAYDYRVDGKIIYENIPLEDMIHIKYFNPQMDTNGVELRGLSPLKVLATRLTRLDSNMDVSVAQMQNGGVNSIVFDKAPNDQTAIEINGQRKDNFYRFLKDSTNTGAPFFASGEMGALQLGLSLADLSVLTLANIDFKKLCNAFGVSDVLFNSDSAATESNVQVMEKRLYTNTVLPNVYRVRDALKASLLDEFEKGRKYTQINEQGEAEVISIQGDGKKRDIQADISEIPCLQEDMSKLAAWLNASPHITYNERREMMHFERIEEPIYDQLLIPTGFQTAEEMKMINNIPGEID